MLLSNIMKFKSILLSGFLALSIGVTNGYCEDGDWDSSDEEDEHSHDGHKRGQHKGGPGKHKGGPGQQRGGPGQQRGGSDQQRGGEKNGEHAMHRFLNMSPDELQKLQDMINKVKNMSEEEKSEMKEK